MNVVETAYVAHRHTDTRIDRMIIPNKLFFDFQLQAAKCMCGNHTMQPNVNTIRTQTNSKIGCTKANGKNETRTRLGVLHVQLHFFWSRMQFSVNEFPI